MTMKTDSGFAMSAPTRAPGHMPEAGETHAAPVADRAPTPIRVNHGPEPSVAFRLRRHFRHLARGAATVRRTWSPPVPALPRVAGPGRTPQQQRPRARCFSRGWGRAG